MKKILLCIWFLVCNFALSFAQGISVQHDGEAWWNEDYNSTEGTEFYLTFMVNYGKQVNDDDLSLSLYASARQTAVVTIEGIFTDYVTKESRPYSKTFTVRGGCVDSVFIPAPVAYLQLGDQTDEPEWLNKGIRVTSTTPISLYSHNANVGSYDASLILPIEGLYKDYVIQTWKDDVQSTEFAIVSSTDGNIINIHLVEQSNAGKTERDLPPITLNRGQSYSYRPQTRLISLTGTTICAAEPIAVFQGGQHVKVPSNIGEASHIYHQTYPTDLWGKNFYVTRTANQSKDAIRITANQNGTKVFKNNTLVKTLNRLETYDEIINWGAGERARFYSTSRSAACFLYQTGEVNGYGSPAMTPITPEEQGIRSSILATFHETRVIDLDFTQDQIDTLNKYYKHYVNIVCPTNIVNGVKIDGVSIGAQFSSIPGTDYSCAIVNVSDTSHVLSNQLGPFTYRVYGIYNYDNSDDESYYDFQRNISYAYAGGSNCLHSAWMLIDGVRTNRKEICEGDPPITFTSVINYDYTNIEWEHTLGGYKSGIIPASLINSDGQRAAGDSVYNWRYIIPDHTQPNWNDTVYMIVTRQTLTDPLCKKTIVDTIKAIIQVNDTFHIDENQLKNLNANVCYSQTDSFYVHLKGKTIGYIPDPSVPQYYNGELIKLEYNKPYSFVDSLLTNVNCDTCLHCDSIIDQVRILRPVYDTIIYDTICVSSLSADRKYVNSSFSDTQGNTRQITIQLTPQEVSSLIRTSSQYKAPLVKEGSTTLKTIYNCDSTVHLKLFILPIYRIEDNPYTTCIDSTAGFAWTGSGTNHNHSNKYRVLSGHNVWMIDDLTHISVHIPVGSRIPLETPGNYTLIDSLVTKGCKTCSDAPGCDSVHTMKLTILSKWERIENKNICDDQTFDWRDTLYVGPKFTGSIPAGWANKYIRVKNDTTLIRSYKTETFACDSTYYLHVKWCPTYVPAIDEKHICVGETYHYRPRYPKPHPHDKLYKWDVGVYELTDTVKTITPCDDTGDGCDSIVKHIIHVHPVYHDTIDTVVCQVHDGLFIWNKHMDTLRTRGIYSVNDHQRVHSIPISQVGDFVYIDSLKTKTCINCLNGVGCDSIWVLRLHINPIIYATKTHIICPEQLPYEYCTGCEKVTEAGTYTETISRDFLNGCDSITTHIIVVEQEVHLPISVEICQNEAPYNYDYGENPSSHRRFTNLTASGTYHDTIIPQGGGCQQILDLTLTVNPIYDDDPIVKYICENDLPYSWTRDDDPSIIIREVNLPEEEKLPYTHTFTSNLGTKFTGCDSIVHLQLTVNRIYADTVYIDTCESEVPFLYEYDGTTYTFTHTVDTLLKTLSHDPNMGCDSTRLLSIRVWPNYSHTTPATICEGDSVFWNGKYWKGTASYQSDTLMRRLYGDSIYRSTEIIHTYQTKVGQHTCDSIERLLLEVIPMYHIHHDTILCDDEGYLLGDSMCPIRPAGYYHDIRIMKTNQGCDSVLSMDVIVNRSFDMPAENSTLCESEEDWSWYPSDKDGIHIVAVPKRDLGQIPFDTTLSCVLHSSTGCDSIVHLNLTVNPNTIKIIDQTICYGQSYQYGSKTASIEGVYRDTLKNANQYGCDSVVVLDLKVRSEIITELEASVCNNELPYNHISPDFTPNLQGLTVSGTYRQVLRSVTDCDSTIVLHLTVNDTTKTDTTYYLCEGDIYEDEDFSNITTTIDTAYTKRLEKANAVGCDSIVNVTVRFGQTYVGDDISQDKDTVLCEREGLFMWYTYDSHQGSPYAYPFTWEELKGKPLDTILYKTLKTDNPFNCDSITSIHVTIKPTLRFVVDTILCPEQLPFQYCENGATVTASDVYPFYKEEYLTSTQYRCDSIVTYRINVQDLDIHVVYDTICNNELPYSYDYPSTGVEYQPEERQRLLNLYRDTIAYDTMHHEGQCLHIVELHLTINDTSKTDTTYYLCEGDIYEDGDFSDITTTTDTAYTKRLEKANAVGCDSIVNVNVRFGRNYKAPTDTIVLCESDKSYLWKPWDSYPLSPYPHLLMWGDLREKVLDTTLIDTLHTATPFYCDSIVSIHITVNPTTINDTSVLWCASAGPFPYGEKGKVTMETGDYIDTLITKNQYGCDSVLHLHFEWKDSIYFHDTVRICDNKAIENHGKLYIGDKYEAFGGTYTESQYDSVHVYSAGMHRDTITFQTSIGCDSSYFIVVDVQPTHYSIQERNACQFEDVTYEAMHNGKGGNVPTTDLGDILFVDTIPADGNGCDSIIHMTYHIRPHYHFSQGNIVVCQTPDSMWIWNNENDDPQDTISLSKGDTIYNLGTNYKTKYGCDSTYGISVYIAPIYHFYDTIFNLCEDDSVSRQGILFVGREFYNYHPNGIDESNYRRVNGNLSGRNEYYTDTAQYFTSAYGCDSVYHFSVKVNPVYRKAIELRTCQTDTGFYYNNLNRGVGGYLQASCLSDSLTRNDTLMTIDGCDSIITLHFYVDSVYHYGIDYTFCQDTIDRMREWIDEENISHGWVLDISKPGDFRIDSVFKTIHGCDSTYGVRWHVDPIYRFDTIIEICEDDRFIWQDTLYTGDSVRVSIPEDSVILVPGIYDRFKHFETVAGCDSDYHAVIYVHAIYDTLTAVTVCESDGFIWHLEEHPNGDYHAYIDTIIPVAYCDTIRILPHEADSLQPSRDTIMRYREHMLQSVHGCDSLSRVWVTVKPTYCFLSDTTICSNNRVKYRGKYFSAKDTTYIESLQTVDGCDSIYILRLHVRPIYMNVRRTKLCDNETLYHHSQNRDDIIWKPGDEIRDPEWEYYDMIYTDKDGCDSIYRYYVTIYPSYSFVDSTIVLCSADSIQLHENRYVGEFKEFPTDTLVEPYHIFYADTLQTHYGCDSIYGIYATIYPSYRHRDTIIICDDEAAEWREHHYEGSMFGNVFGGGLTAGEHIFRDSFITYNHGCDSIYELHLIVNKTYLFVDSISKCADEDFSWRGRNFDHAAVGEYFVYDSITTKTFGCDSVYHLYLTVNDTTSEIRHDTICRTETYDFHGKELIYPGYYYDTTLNEWGCHHYTYLYLTIIEPTIPTAWVDSICANDSAYDLFYTYTGELDPIAYSLYYDDDGHANGFEDIENQPITTPEELYWLTIPMPNVQEDRTKYPKPNYYKIKLVLDNGICTNPDLCSTDTSVVLSYPSWITRQRFGDVIALYNEKYNGGYKWWKYQWYHEDTLLVGETHEYLYLPTGLVIGDQYYVRLTREGETMDFQTCPITIVADPIDNDFAPNMGYLAVVQSTCVCSCHPHVNILSRNDGAYRIITSNGLLVEQGKFSAPVEEVILPAIDGMYIVHLWSAETPEEQERIIKVFVEPQCPNYENIPF